MIIFGFCIFKVIFCGNFSIVNVLVCKCEVTVQWIIKEVLCRISLLYLVLFLVLFFFIFLLLIIMWSISSPVSSPWPVLPQVRTMPHWWSLPSCLRASVLTTCLSLRAIGRSCLLAMMSSGVSVSWSWKVRVLCSSEYRILYYSYYQLASTTTRPIQLTNSGLLEAPVVRGVKDEYDPVTVAGVSPPQRSDLLLPPDVPDEKCCSC